VFSHGLLLDSFPSRQPKFLALGAIDIHPTVKLIHFWRSADPGMQT
jgi:hypothetical protein